MKNQQHKKGRVPTPSGSNAKPVVTLQSESPQVPYRIPSGPVIVVLDKTTK